MTKIRGKDGTVKIGAASIAEIQEFEYNEESDLIEHPSMGDTYKTRTGDLLDYSGSLKCWYDPSDASQDLMVAGATVTLIMIPEGDTSGNETITVSGIIQSRPLTQAVGGMAEMSFAWVGDGTTPVYGTVA